MESAIRHHCTAGGRLCHWDAICTSYTKVRCMLLFTALCDWHTAASSAIYFLCSPNFFRLHLVNCLASGFSSNYAIISYLFDPQYTCTGVVGVVILALSLTVFEETALFWCSRQALTLQSPTVRASVLY